MCVSHMDVSLLLNFFDRELRAKFKPFIRLMSNSDFDELMASLKSTYKSTIDNVAPILSSMVYL